MAHVVLFHSALGLRPGVHQAAERLRAAGHQVALPDLFDGALFDDADEGVAHAEALGFDTIESRAEAALREVPYEIVVAGMSMGVGIALGVATGRPGVRGALLMHAGRPPDGPWPAGVPVEVHHSVGDRWVDPGATPALVEAVARSGSPASLHLYPGEGHLFTDPDLAEYDADAAELLWQRALAFLAGVDAGGQGTMTG